MAAWQFDVYLIARGASVPDSDAEYWETPALPLTVVRDIQDELAHYLGPPWLMLPEWLVFGPENGNRIDLVFETEDSGSIFVRCDLRQEAPQFFVLVCNLAHGHGCQLFNPQNRECIEPTIGALESAMAGL
jgi:hypothetical protein